jgi:hypothetical protein
MIKVISILCVASIILGVVGFSIFMLRRQKQRHKSAFFQFAQQHSFALFETEAAIDPFYDALNRFDFFRTGSNSRIRRLIQGKVSHSPVEIMLATLTHSGTNQGFTDEYAVIRWRHDQLHLPHFILQPKGYAVERALNALLVGKEPQVALTEYPSLSQHYQLTGTEPEAIGDLFNRGIGNYFDGQVQRSIHRSIEGLENQFLFYTYLNEEITADELHQLFEESKHVLNLLEQAATN